MIKRFRYSGRSFPSFNDEVWSLETVEFGALNLLVGPSGVGKTRILRALLEVRQVALHGLEGTSSGRWELELELDGQVMRWLAAARTYSKDYPHLADQFFEERLVIDGEVVVDRDQRKFKYKGTQLPQLDKSRSCVELLSSEPDLQPFLSALRPWRFHLGDSIGDAARFFTAQAADAALKGFNSNLSALQSDVELNPVLKLLVLQHFHQEQFQGIVRDFQEIFPSVEEIKIGLVADFGAVRSLGEPYEGNMVGVGIREAGISSWVLHPDFSAGMAKALELLIETRLSPTEGGGVLMIDELENSLGVNCLAQVTGMLLEGLDRRQVIATSHHFRVINEIPFSSLKLVERSGSTVRVRDASEIPAVKNAGSLDRFTELLNYLERQQERE